MGRNIAGELGVGDVPSEAVEGGGKAKVQPATGAGLGVGAGATTSASTADADVDADADGFTDAPAVAPKSPPAAVVRPVHVASLSRQMCIQVRAVV